jgi:alpha-galactosidase
LLSASFPMLNFTYMISKQQNAFHLASASLSYVVRINKIGKPVLDYFGLSLPDAYDLSSLSFDPPLIPGRSISYSKEHPEISLSSLPLELSTRGKGDFLSPSLKLESEDSSLFDFLFLSGEIRKKEDHEGYPEIRGSEEELVLSFLDKPSGVVVELHYSVFPGDVFGRYVKIVNKGEKDVTIRKISSLCMEIENKGYLLHSFHSGWINEFDEEVLVPSRSLIRLESSTGSSSDLHNPFFYLAKKDSSYSSSPCLGFNLVYSGNHQEEVQEHNGYLRILSGLSEEDFAYPLSPGGSFSSPLAVFTFSNRGRNGMAKNFHEFVRECVLPPSHASSPRPIVYNNWEGTYFKFSEAKLHSLTKQAKDLGAELFVLDDGWFGKRDDDKSSLGDWKENRSKLPHGIKGLGEHLHKNGLLFGLWFEPEAISPDSDLYRAHPDWAISSPNVEASLGRNELLLDLTRPEVRAYLFERISFFVEEGKIDFIKWDYNRVFSDIGKNSGVFGHRYIMALYALLKRIREAFPDLWMENCASGGGRNDLGMFAYFDTGWVSDDTDSYQRSLIQSHMALGYPLCLMSNHVSAKTNHQTLRKTSFGTKFDVAMLGALGYELNPSDLDEVERKEIKEQISFYKENRLALQFGEYRLLEDYQDRGYLIQEVAFDGKAFVSLCKGMQQPSPKRMKLRAEMLDGGSVYSYSVRKENVSLLRFGGLVNMLAPIRLKEEGFLINAISRHKALENEKFEGLVSGSVLLSDGLLLPQEWSGTGLNENIAVILDFGARVYCLQKIGDARD